MSDLRVTVEVARVVGLSLREQEAQTMVGWTVAVRCSSSERRGSLTNSTDLNVPSRTVTIINGFGAKQNDEECCRVYEGVRDVGDCRFARSGPNVYATSYSCADLFTVSFSLSPFHAQSLVVQRRLTG